MLSLDPVLQLLEEPSVYQVIPFMTHLELNHIKDDKTDPEKAHKGQEGVKLVYAGLQPEYKGRFKLQVLAMVIIAESIALFERDHDRPRGVVLICTRQQKVFNCGSSLQGASCCK